MAIVIVIEIGDHILQFESYQLTKQHEKLVI